MNSSEIFDAIEEIAATPGKNDKQALVAKHGADTHFAHVLNAAMNPFITYGIANVPDWETKVEGEGSDFNAETQVILQHLAERKLTGNGARSAVRGMLDELNAKSAELFTRIIKKDLRAGFGESTVNKAIKGFLPDFPYMRCSLPKHTDLSKWDWKNGILSQEKADGMFVNINREPEMVSLTSRQGTPIPTDAFGSLVDAFLFMLKDNTQTHGELLVEDPDHKVYPREIGNGKLNSVIQGGALDKGDRIVCKVWDQIPLSEVKPKGRYSESYDKRFMSLFKQLTKVTQLNPALTMIDTRIVRSLEGVYQHYREYLQQGKEGTVIKQRETIWGDYTSKSQVKLKLEADCELKVVGFEDGKGKNKATFGSIICETECEQLRVSVSGLTDAKRQAIHDAREDWLGKIITVRSNSIMVPSSEGKLHSLFLPRFVEERNDKSVADTLARVKEQFDNAVAAV